MSDWPRSPSRKRIPPKPPTGKNDDRQKKKRNGAKSRALSYGKLMTSLLIPKDSRTNPKRILSGIAFLVFICFFPVRCPSPQLRTGRRPTGTPTIRLSDAPVRRPIGLIMRAVIQRVSDARVTVQEAVLGEIGTGLMVLIGFGNADQADFAGSPQWTKNTGKDLEPAHFP